MNTATAQLTLSLLDGYQDMEDNDKEFDDTINKEHRINPDSDNEDGKDFLENDLIIHLEDHTLGEDYDTTHTNQFGEPDNFKELL